MAKTGIIEVLKKDLKYMNLVLREKTFMSDFTAWFEEFSAGIISYEESV